MKHKTIFERLMEFVKGDTDDTAKFCEAFDSNIANYRGMRDAAKTIAYTINVEYIPRPRFEDGSIVRPGDKISYNGGAFEIDNIQLMDDGSYSFRSGKRQTSLFTEDQRVTKYVPDTFEKIKEESRKEYTAYWDCAGIRCDECPAKIDGMRPSEYHHVDDCEEAMLWDVLFRYEDLIEGANNGK